MLRSYSIVYNCHFVHDQNKGNCRAQLIYQTSHMLVIKFCTDSNDGDVYPAKYALSEYCGKYWLTNLDEHFSVFLHNPLNVVSTTDELEDQNIGEMEAEQIAEVICFFYNLITPRNPGDLEEDKFPFIEDDELPF